MMQKHCWIQYSYDDTENAAILQTATDEVEARGDDELIMSGCPWYRYDIVVGAMDGGLVNENGPHYFSKP